MNWFRRLCLVVFGLAGLATIAALGLPWVGPWQKAATALLAEDWYLTTVEVLAGISALGLLISLLRGIFSRSNKRFVVVSRLDGGQVTVTRDAIASQASHIVADDGSCQADRVRVSIRGGKVRVRVRVLPFETVDVVAKGAQLHDALMDGLAKVCGDTIKGVDLEFVEPEQVTVPEGEATVAVDAAGEAAVASEPVTAGVEAEPARTEPPATSEITVHMGIGSPVLAPHVEPSEPAGHVEPAGHAESQGVADAGETDGDGTTTDEAAGDEVTTAEAVRESDESDDLAAKGGEQDA